MHTHHARVPVGGRLGVALQVKGCTRGALGSHAWFSQRGESSTPPCRGLLASLPHVVPSAGRHQPGNPPVQGRHSCLQYLRSHVAGGRASQMYTNHVRRLISHAQVCPLSLFRTLTFKIWGPQGCQAALWPWDARDVVPARGLSSQLSVLGESRHLMISVFCLWILNNSYTILFTASSLFSDCFPHSIWCGPESYSRPVRCIQPSGAVSHPELSV